MTFDELIDTIKNTINASFYHLSNTVVTVGGISASLFGLLFGGVIISVLIYVVMAVVNKG